MNKELLKLVKASGAPKQVLNELWFQIFCEKFAGEILDMVIAETEEQYEELYQIEKAKKEAKYSTMN